MKKKRMGFIFKPVVVQNARICSGKLAEGIILGEGGV